MRGPRFTLRQAAFAIAVISAVLAFWVRSPIPLESLVPKQALYINGLQYIT